VGNFPTILDQGILDNIVKRVFRWHGISTPLYESISRRHSFITTKIQNLPPNFNPNLGPSVTPRQVGLNKSNDRKMKVRN
jgi:hypothetical protein